mgnify:CR=1 FL=1
MKALVKAEAAPGLWLQDVPEPETRAGEVRIRVLRTGICGTDLHEYAYGPIFIPKDAATGKGPSRRFGQDHRIQPIGRKQRPRNTALYGYPGSAHPRRFRGPPQRNARWRKPGLRGTGR